MGRFYDLIDNSGDPYLIPRAVLELWLSEFVLEISDTKDEDLRKLLTVWLG
jgi:hypothetical protein